MRPDDSPPIRSPLIHARNTCWAPCTWPASVSARMPNVRGRSSTAAAAKGEPRAAYALAALAAHDSPADESAARTWLAKAAAAGHADAARLLQAGQLPLQVDPRVLATEPAVTLSMTIAAARRGDVDTLATLWPLLPKDASDAFRRSVLHHAAESGAAESVRWLVKHDARVDAIDAQGITPVDAGGDGRTRGRPGRVVAVQSSRCRGGCARELGSFLCGTPRPRRAGRAPGGGGPRSKVAQCGWLERRRLLGAIEAGRRHRLPRPARRTAGAPAQYGRWFRLEAVWPNSALVGRRCLRRMAGRGARRKSQRSGHAESRPWRGAATRKQRLPPASQRCMSLSPRHRPLAVGVLLAAGASPTRPDRAGHTPLGVAVSQGQQGNRADAARARRQPERAWRERQRAFHHRGSPG